LTVGHPVLSVYPYRNVAHETSETNCSRLRQNEASKFQSQRDAVRLDCSRYSSGPKQDLEKERHAQPRCGSKSHKFAIARLLGVRTRPWKIREIAYGAGPFSSLHRATVPVWCRLMNLITKRQDTRSCASAAYNKSIILQGFSWESGGEEQKAGGLWGGSLPAEVYGGQQPRIRPA
jgi:hypothetical protein